MHTALQMPTAQICPGRSLAFAINHFTGSRDFIRALRYWANQAPPAVETARALNAEATGLKLTEYGLVPIAKQDSVRDGRVYRTNMVRACPSTTQASCCKGLKRVSTSSKELERRGACLGTRCPQQRTCGLYFGFCS